MIGRINPFVVPLQPYWAASINPVAYPVLREESRVDAAIIGGGLVGMTTAYLLVMEGLTCTHLGCEPAWNEAELSWDCPCHGSRYTYSGEIIEGPTLEPLQTKFETPNP